MAGNPLKMLIPKRSLGVDIGTSLVKIVEVSRFGHRRKLEGYGSLTASVLYDKPFRTFEKSTLLLSSSDIAKAIKAIVEEAEMKANQAIFSIPDFSTFFTNFELPPMSAEELPQAVRYQARSQVPLPLAEVTLDWQVISGQASEEGKANLKVLLVAVPNEVINQYREIAKASRLELVALEAEAFSLARPLVSKEERGTIGLVDIGAQSTTCNIIDRRVLKKSYSFDMSGNELTKVVARGLDVDYAKAEELKGKYGLAGFDQGKEGQEVEQILLPLVDVILREVEGVLSGFEQREQREIKKIIIAGGSALLPGLEGYFRKKFKKEVEIANPFSSIFYPPILEKTLKEMGPSYAIAVGAALRGLEY